MASELQVFEQANLAVFQRLHDFKKQKEEMEKAEKELKDYLLQAMEENGIKSFKNEYITISHIEASTSTSIDLKALEKEEPELYKDLLKDYPKVTSKKAYTVK